MKSNKLSKKKIKEQLVASNHSDLPDKFVAAAVYIDESGALYHAGIAVGSEAGKNLFHFNAESLEQIPLEHCIMFYQRDFRTIPDYLADAFHVHCAEAVASSVPEYGKFYNGAYFEDGKLINPEKDPYRMSCVGFCLAILQGWDTDDIFIMYEDWTADNSLSDSAIAAELAELKQIYPELDENDFSNNIRRIKPSEFLAAAYLDTTPVRKTLTDPIAVVLKEIALEIKEEKATDD